MCWSSNLVAASILFSTILFRGLYIDTPSSSAPNLYSASEKTPFETDMEPQKWSIWKGNLKRIFHAPSFWGSKCYISGVQSVFEKFTRNSDSFPIILNHPTVFFGGTGYDTYQMVVVQVKRIFHLKISGCHKLALTIPTVWFQPSWIISQFEGVEKKIHLDNDAGETNLPQLSWSLFD